MKRHLVSGAILSLMYTSIWTDRITVIIGQVSVEDFHVYVYDDIHLVYVFRHILLIRV